MVVTKRSRWSSGPWEGDIETSGSGMWCVFVSCCSMSSCFAVMALIRTSSVIARSLTVSVVDLSVRECGCTLTLRTSPFLSGSISTMVAVDHCNRGRSFSIISTMSPTCTLRCVFVHLDRVVPMSYKYCCQSYQNMSAKASTRFQRLAPYALKSCSENNEGLTFVSLHPSSRCVNSLCGEIGSGSLGESGGFHSGVEFTILAAWRSIVVNSSRSSNRLPVSFGIRYPSILSRICPIARSHTPPK